MIIRLALTIAFARLALSVVTGDVLLRHDPCWKAQFLDPNVGFLLGEDGLLRTGDGGRTWTPIYQRPGSLAVIGGRDFHFVSPNEGWVVNDVGDVFRTEDSGKSWASLPSVASAVQVSLGEHVGAAHIRFLDDRRGWIEGGVGKSEGDLMYGVPRFVVVATADGGLSWQEIKVGGNREPILAWIGESLVCATTDQSLLYSSDGGKTWVRAGNVRRLGIEHLLFVDANRGYALGSWGVVMRTDDGGRTWSKTVASPSYRLDSTVFVGRDTGWILGYEPTPSGWRKEAVLLRTEDGGRSWKVIYRDPRRLAAMSFINNRDGWLAVTRVSGGLYAAHRPGELTILRSADGGRSWNSVYVNK